jgi:hypothetical protein
MAHARSCLLAGLGALAACRSIETEVPLVSAAPFAIHATPARAWSLRTAHAELGEVVYFESATGPRESVFVVRNPWSQDLGIVDSLGRAYRYLPHCREPVWVGTGTLAEGAAFILQAAEPCELVEVPMPLAEERARLAAARSAAAQRPPPAPALRALETPTAAGSPGN